jgi:enoyl-CoA hydratase
VDLISLNEVEGMRVLTLNRPPANAMNVEFLHELSDSLGTLAGDPPSAVVLAGQDPFFSGGADLKAVPTYGPEQHRQMVDAINRMAIEAYALPSPVVGAITGHAIAGGMVLALCCDMRIASSAGRYGLTEIKVGVPYPQAAIMVVRAELPPHAARRLAFGNQLTNAAECVALGAFDEALAPTAVMPRALELARELGAMPADVYARTKRDLRGATLAAMRDAAAADPLLQR